MNLDITDHVKYSFASITDYNYLDQKLLPAEKGIRGKGVATNDLVILSASDRCSRVKIYWRW